MSLSTKDYSAIAAILAGDLAVSTTKLERRKVRYITYSLADYFKQTNARFDREQFYLAVGLSAFVPGSGHALCAECERGVEVTSDGKFLVDHEFYGPGTGLCVGSGERVAE